MQTAARTIQRHADTYLTHFFGGGLDGGDREFVVERFRSAYDGEIKPVDDGQQAKGGRARPRRTVSLRTVRNLRPAHDEIIVATSVSRDAGIQLYGPRPRASTCAAAGAERRRRRGRFLMCAPRRPLPLRQYPRHGGPHVRPGSRQSRLRSRPRTRTRAAQVSASDGRADRRWDVSQVRHCPARAGPLQVRAVPGEGTSFRSRPPCQDQGQWTLRQPQRREPPTCRPCQEQAPISCAGSSRAVRQVRPAPDRRRAQQVRAVPRAQKRRRSPPVGQPPSRRPLWRLRRCGTQWPGPVRSVYGHPGQSVLEEGPRPEDLRETEDQERVRGLQRTLDGRGPLSHLRTEVLLSLGRASRHALGRAHVLRHRDRDGRHSQRMGQPSRGPRLPRLRED